MHYIKTKRKNIFENLRIDYSSSNINLHCFYIPDTTGPEKNLKCSYKRWGTSFTTWGLKTACSCCTLQPTDMSKGLLFTGWRQKSDTTAKSMSHNMEPFNGCLLSYILPCTTGRANRIHVGFFLEGRGWGEGQWVHYIVINRLKVICKTSAESSPSWSPFSIHIDHSFILQGSDFECHPWSQHWSHVWGWDGVIKESLFSDLVAVYAKDFKAQKS